MSTTRDFLSQFDELIVSRINSVESDGQSFLTRLNLFSDAELIDIIKSEGLFDYMKRILMEAQTDGPVLFLQFD